MNPEEPIIPESKVDQLIRLLKERSESDKKIQSEYHWLAKAVNTLRANKQATTEKLLEHSCSDCRFWEEIKKFNGGNAIASRAGFCSNQKVNKSFHTLTPVPESLPILNRQKDIITASWFGCKEFKYQKKILNGVDISTIKIVDVDFSVRALNCLKSVNIQYLTELTGWTKERVMAIHNMGKRTASQIEGIMDNYGLALAKSGE